MPDQWNGTEWRNGWLKYVLLSRRRVVDDSGGRVEACGSPPLNGVGSYSWKLVIQSFLEMEVLP